MLYQELKKDLNRLHDAHQRNIESDPIYFAHQYTDPQDRELIAFISAMYAFGQVKAIFGSLRNFTTFLGYNPAQKILTLNETELKKYSFAKHRWITPDDTRSFFRLLKKILKQHGSLEKSFLQFYDSQSSTIEAAMIQWMESFKKELISMQKKPLTLGQKFLLASPDKNSASKRLLMCLRWMVRTEYPDLGLWKNVSPSKLLMPIDVHLFRFSKYFGFTRRKQSDWKAVVEITGHFQKVNAEDPVRYDFSLARLGILNLCIHKFSEQHCNPCLIGSHCRLKKRNRNS
jgi:uncharacterized protein (TIGR02757 family)